MNIRSLIVTAIAGLLIVSPLQSVNAKTAPKSPVVTLTTNKGIIIIKLFPNEAPISSQNFIKLVKKGFYNGLTFHRIENLNGKEPGPRMKIVQGGSPSGNGSGGPGYTIKGEFKENGVNNPLTHTQGAVAMARTDAPNSAGCQFYICVDAVHFLDNKYAVFGMVIKGLDVADKLVVGDKIISAKLSE